MVSLSELASTYWYVLLIIGLVIVYYLWKGLDVYTKMQIRKIFSGKTLLVILFIGGWWAWHKWGGTELVYTADRWMPVILFAFLTGLYYIGKLRYETQQVVCPNFHGSYNKAPYKVNGFYIFAVDSFNAGGLSWDYAQRILVVREETCELLREGAVSIAHVGFVTRYELPEDVMSFIESNKFLKSASKEVYYGWFDDIERIDWTYEQLWKAQAAKNDPKSLYSLLKKTLRVNNPKVSTLFWAYRNQSKAVNKQTEWYDATIDSSEKGQEHRKRMKDSYAPTKDEQPRVEGHEEV